MNWTGLNRGSTKAPLPSSQAVVHFNDMYQAPVSALQFEGQDKRSFIESIIRTVFCNIRRHNPISAHLVIR